MSKLDDELTRRISMFPIISAKLFLPALLISGGLFVSYLTYISSWDSCVREIRTETYISASSSCNRAKLAGWPFQLFNQRKYAQVLNNSGLARLETRNFPLAKKDLEDALHRWEKLAPEGARSYAVVLNNIGLLSFRDGNVRAEEYWLRRSTSMFHELRLYCDHTAATADSNLGSVLTTLGRLDEAETVLQVRITRNSECSDLPRYEKGSTQRRWGELQMKLGDRDAALNAFDVALDLFQSARDEGSLEMAKTLISRATLLRRLGRFSDAERDIIQALPMLRRSIGADSPESGTAHSVLANSLRVQGKYEQALQEYFEAERIYRASLGVDHPWLATIQMLKGKTYRALGQSEEATNAFKEAERIRSVVSVTGTSQVSLPN